MKTSLLASLLILLFLAPSCKKEDNAVKNITINQDKILEISFDNIPVAEQGIKFSDIFSDFQVITLETKPECVIGNTKIEFINENIYVGTQNFPGAAKLYKFRKDGTFVNEIGKEGNGPGEHTGYLVYSISQPNDADAIVVDWGGQNPQLFLENGEFKREVKQPLDLLSNVFPWDTNTWFSVESCIGQPFYPRDSIKLIFYDSNGKTEKIIPRKIYPNTKLYTPTIGFVSCYRFDKKWKVYIPGTDTIFQVIDKDLKPDVVIDVGQDKITYNSPIAPSKLLGKAMIQIISETSNNLIIRKNIITQADVNEYQPGKWGGRYNSEAVFIIIDKKSHKAIQGKLIDDFIKFLPQETFNYILEWRNDFAFISLQATSYLKYKQNIEKSSQEFMSINDKLKNISENSNPIIFTFKIKDRIKF